MKSGEQRIGADGVRTERGTGASVAWVLGLVLALAALGLGVSAWVLLFPGTDVDVPAHSAVSAAAIARPPASPRARAPRLAVAPSGTTRVAPAPAAVGKPSPAADSASPQAPTSGDGGPSGVALFPPPGTKPLKRGILVPEGFELPPGYVRHYQATDDGGRVPAILMFHPDYTPRDATGKPVPIPADRVVPPELAPPGLPIELLELPPAHGADDANPP